MDTNRLAKELREIQSDTKSGVTVEVLGDNLAHMQGTLKGEARPSRVSSAAPGSARQGATQIRPFARPPRSTVDRRSHVPTSQTPHSTQDPRNPRTRAANST